MKSVPNPQKVKRNSRTRHVGMMVLMVLLLIMAFAASIFVSSSLFSRATREYREEIITKAARLAAGQIDGDRINQWLESGADAAYIKTASLLQKHLHQHALCPIPVRL